MTTIIGLEVQPMRLDFAVHTKNLVMHKFERDGTIYVPSSMIDNVSDHRTVIYQGLHENLSDYKDEIYDLGVYVGENVQSVRKLRESLSARNEQLLQSQGWIHEAIDSFFALETLAIRIVGDNRCRRKALRELAKLENYPSTRTYVNWVALEGAKEIENI